MGEAARREPFNPTKFAWPRHLARLLGKLPDSKVAARAGLHLVTVTRERQRRGIPPAVRHRPPIEWTREQIALLGTASDPAVAAELGVHRGSVARKRLMLGIPAFNPVEPKESDFWTPERIARLGTEHDGDLARKWKVGVVRVAYKRTMLQIPPFEPRPARVRWTQAMLRQLGKVADVAFAKKFGITENTVFLKRRELGVPPFRPRRAKVVRSRALRPLLALRLPEAVSKTGLGHSTIATLRSELGVPVPPRSRAATPWALSRLGKVPDERLAAELGLRPSTVRSKRRRMGILKRRVRRWTAAEDRVVRALPAREAAAKLGRTHKAVLHRRARLGLSGPQGKQRR